MRALQTQHALTKGIFHLITLQQRFPLSREAFAATCSWGGVNVYSCTLSLWVLLWKKSFFGKNYGLVWRIPFMVNRVKRMSLVSLVSIHMILDLINSLKDPLVWWNHVILAWGIVVVRATVEENLLIVFPKTSLGKGESQKSGCLSDCLNP